MQKIVLVAVTILSFIELKPFESSLADKYINRYHQIAIAEMDRAHIPASIKLAQGLLESDWGRSDLASVAKNHFGIKCGSKWTGDVFYKEDDDFNKQGELIESCFRAYRNAEISYIAHSDFLTAPRASRRYDFLFEYKKTDYKSWAKGLYKAGYATDSKYPDKLIQIIEKYDLHKYDKMSAILEEPLLVENDNIEPDIDIEEKSNSRGNLSKNTEISYENDRAMILSKENESPRSISRKYKVELYQLLGFNDNLGDSKTVLPKGTIVYLEARNAAFRKNSNASHHNIRKGESMRSIARLYGIDLNNLYSKNRIPKGAEPLVGQNIKLDGMVTLGKRPKFKTKTEVIAEQEIFLFEEDFAGNR